MFIMITVASLCSLVVGVDLIRQACRDRKDLWIVSDDAILCLVSPLTILLATLGAVSLAWRLTHGGIAAVSARGWVGSLAIVAASIVVRRVLAARIRGSGKAPASVAPRPVY